MQARPDPMKTQRLETRRYPIACTSTYCGGFGDDCKGCRHKPALDDFKTWRDETGAVQIAPVWCPSFWTAIPLTRGDHR